MATTERTGWTQSLAFIVGASSVGTLIEWYDFYIYGVLAAVFAKQFFPPGNENLAFLASLAIFWFTFMLTLGMMGLATFLVGCIPSYASWGLPRRSSSC